MSCPHSQTRVIRSCTIAFAMDIKTSETYRVVPYLWLWTLREWLVSKNVFELRTQNWTTFLALIKRLLVDAPFEQVKASITFIWSELLRWKWGYNARADLMGSIKAETGKIEMVAVVMNDKGFWRWTWQKSGSRKNINAICLLKILVFASDRIVW